MITGRGRPRALRILMIAAASLITVKMLYLQVARSSYYRAKADEQHQGTIELAARRGDVQILSASGERTALAMDVTRDLVYADPSFLQLEMERDGNDGARALEEAADFLVDQFAELEPTGAGEQLYRGQDLPKDKAERRDALRGRILELLKAREVSHVTVLGKDGLTPELAKKIEELHLRGVFVTQEEVYVDPTLVVDSEIVAKLLAPLVDSPLPELRERLRRRPIRYVVLKRNVPPEVSKAISEQHRAKRLLGIGLVPEHWRFYPEGELAANVVGFVNREGRGQYGIEESFDDAGRDVTLRGVDGWVRIDRDPNGRQIAVGEETTVAAKDGDDLVLTIDRVVQQKMEEILKQAVEDARGEKGCLVVMDPSTGRIIAMASYPTFDPNDYRAAMAKIENGPEKGRYVNKVGPLAYVNVAVDVPYEPGSVFKVVTMAAGIDTGDISPETVTYDRTGYIEVDEYVVRNSSLKAEGRMTMTNVLERSSNLGAAFVSRRLGRSLFYKYIQDFGFGDPTDIQFSNEHPGWLKEPQTWAEIDLVTASFGQGISANPVQVTSAVAAIANGGRLMRPTIIDRVIQSPDEDRERHEEPVDPVLVRQVIRPETAAKVTGMMVSVVDRGTTPKAKVPGYYVAGKTGTSQIAKENGGGYEKGPGSTIATLAGFAPAGNPKVVVFVRIDRPLADYWGSTIAAPAFSRAMTWLMRYYAIAPQR